jgi:hypothetical protein
LNTIQYLYFNADSEDTIKQLIIELDTNRDQVVDLPSPKVQLDGPMEEGKVKYTMPRGAGGDVVKTSKCGVFMHC